MRTLLAASSDDEEDVSLTRAPTPFLKALPSRLKYLSKTPPPFTVMLGLGFQVRNHTAREIFEKLKQRGMWGHAGK